MDQDVPSYAALPGEDATGDQQSIVVASSDAVDSSYSQMPPASEEAISSARQEKAEEEGEEGRLLVSSSSPPPHSCSPQKSPALIAALQIIQVLNAKAGNFTRVKLYVADGDGGRWDGHAVGNVSIRQVGDKFHLVLLSDNRADGDSTPVADERGPSAGESRDGGRGDESVAGAPVVTLDTPIDSNINYQIQNSSIITWQEGDQAKGLSFVNTEGCHAVWSALSLLVPERITDADDDDDQVDDSEATMMSGRRETDLSGDLSDEGESAAGSSGILDPPHRASDIAGLLPHLRMLSRTASPIQKAPPRYMDEMRKLLQEMSQDAYLDSLWKLLYKSIRAQNFDACADIAVLLYQFIAMYVTTFNPFASLALHGTRPPRYLDPQDPIVRILSDTHYLNFFRAMEFEPELRRHSAPINHVAFLSEVSSFQPVLCQDDDSFRVTCQLIYRLLYIRDVCSPRHLDDITIQRLNSIISSGYAYVCRLLQLNPSSFRILKSMIPNSLQAARFLLQLLTVLRSNIIASQEKSQVYASLKSENVLEALIGYITGDCPVAREWPAVEAELRAKQDEAEQRLKLAIQNDPDCRHRPSVLAHERMTIPKLPEVAMEIFHQTVDHNPALLRQSLLSAVDASGSPILWNALCSLFRTSGNQGLLIQLAEVFRKVLDSATLDDPEKDDLLSLFYDHGVIDKVINIILTPPPQSFTDLLALDANGPRYYIDSDELRHAVRITSPPAEDTPSTFSRRRASPTRLPSAAGQLTPLARAKSTDGSREESTSPEMRPRGLHRTSEEASHDDTSDAEYVPPAKRRRSGSSQDSSCMASAPNSATRRLQGEEAGAAATEDSQLNGAGGSERRIEDSVTPRQKRVNAELSREDLRARHPLDGLDLGQEKKELLLFESQSQLSFAKCQICEILSFCVLKHSSRIMYRNLERNLHARLIEAACSPTFDQFFALYAVKYLKSCIVAQSDHYSRLFVRDNVFYYIFKLLRRCVARPICRGDGSVLESAILELFHGIAKAASASPPMGQLLRHIMENYAEVVHDLNQVYISTCGCRLFAHLEQHYNALVKNNSRLTPGLSSSYQSNLEKPDVWNLKYGSHYQDARTREHWNEENYFDSDDYDTTSLTLGGERSSTAAPEDSEGPLNVGNEGCNDGAINEGEKNVSTEADAGGFQAFLRSAARGSGNNGSASSDDFRFLTSGETDDEAEDEEIPEFMKKRPLPNAGSAPSSVPPDRRSARKTPPSSEKAAMVVEKVLG